MEEGCFKRSPVHVAASRGHKRVVKQFLDLNKGLAQVVDSENRTPLHLASAKGHSEVVNILVQANPDMCLARDREGRNPLHVAALNGHESVLRVLVATKHLAARVRVDGDTVLHLCVKHNRLNSLSLLLRKIKSPELVNAKDSDGNTILHLAVLAKQLEIVRNVLENHKIDVNATNKSGKTAMDILLLARKGMDSEDSTHGGQGENPDPDIEDFLRQAKAKESKDLVQGDWLTKKRETLMIVASLLATMAFQAGVNPPGGAWQDNSNSNPNSTFSSNETEHRAGEAIMAYIYPDSYPWFLRLNTIGFVASLSTILLLISGLRFTKRAYIWVLIVIMWVTITSMAGSYAISIVWLTPKKDRKSLICTLAVAIMVWCGVMLALLIFHTYRLMRSGLEEQQSRNKAIRRITRHPSHPNTPRAEIEHNAKNHEQV